MLSRLVFGAAALSFAYLLVTYEHRSNRVARTYQFSDAGEGFDVVSDAIEREYADFGVESKLEPMGSRGRVRTSRRCHEAIACSLIGLRLGHPAAVLA